MALIGLAGVGSAQASGSACALYAAPNGSDSYNGSAFYPYATVTKLDHALRPGQTGCLRTGFYGSINAWHDLSNNGSPWQPITITAAPGASVVVVGWVDIEGAYTTVSHLNIDGTNQFYRGPRPTSGPARGCGAPASQGLLVNGPGDVFEHNNLFQSNPWLRSVGIGIGWVGHPDNAIIRFNKIHDVGACAANDHVIYLASGNNVEIYDNWMWNDPHGWGVQLYPHPTNAKIFGNVIDHVGSGFVVGNSPGQTTSGNQITWNVVSNSTGLPAAGLPYGVAISEDWEGSPGAGNSFVANDSFNNPGGISRASHLSVAWNLTDNPAYVNAAADNFTAKDSAMAKWWMWNGL